MSAQVQLGQAMPEVLMVAAALALALFLPYVNGESVVTLLVKAVMGALRARTFLVSIL